MMYCDATLASTSTTIQPLGSQVGGHPGVVTIENGLLLIKPAVPVELAFYQRLQQDSNLENLRAFTPTFLGTLKLIGKVDETGSAVSESIVIEPVASEEKDESLVLLVSQFRQVVSPDTYMFFLIKSTIHCSRKSLILFPQTKRYRYQARDGVIR